MPDHDNTSLTKRIATIEDSLRKLGRDISRVAALTTRNRADLDHALADIDELLYTALASGHELTPGEHRLKTNETGDAGPPRCTHPVHDSHPPARRPVATHQLELRSPHTASGEPHPPLPRCADCAARVLKSPSGGRIRVRRTKEGDRRAGRPRCQSPVHLAGDIPPATTVIVTAGARPGIRYCDECAETTRTTLRRHRIPCESAPVAARKPVRPKPSAERR